MSDPAPPPPPPGAPPPPKEASKPAVQIRTAAVSDLVQKRLSTLAWRNGRGTLDEYSLEVDGVKIEFAQRTQSELTGFGTGGNIWNGAIILAKYLEKKFGGGKGSGDLFKGKKVLEIGSGTGVAGIVCAKFFEGADFVLTDQKQVLELIEENVKRNASRIPALADHVKVQELDWGGAVDHLNPGPPYDWIIACECVAPIFRLDLLIESLKALTGEQTTILMAYEHRHDSCRVNFFQKAEQDGFVFERIPESELHENYRADDIELWHIRRPKVVA